MPSGRIPRTGAAALLCCVLGAPAHAVEAPPLTNHAALSRTFALPDLGGGSVLAADASRWRATFGMINEFEIQDFATDQACATPECLWIDGEAYRVAIGYRGGLGDGWEWSFDVPVLFQDGGFMDGMIENWHGFFGLPNGGRELVPRDQYLFRYDRSGATVLLVDEPRNGIGDLRLGAAWQAGSRLAVRGQVKLPTGDESRLSGGNPGAAVWLDGELPLEGPAGGFAAIGVSVADRSEVLPDQQRRVVGFGGFGLSVPATESVSLQVQLYLHGALYDDTEMRALRRNGALLGIGLRYRTASGSWIDIGFHEDLNVNVSPDFVLQMAVSWMD